MINKIIDELKYWRDESNRCRNDVKMREEYYKRCYELCLTLKWQRKKLNQIEEVVGITKSTITLHAKTYALNHLKMSEQEFRNMIYRYVYDEMNRSRSVKYLDEKFYVLLKQLKEIPLNDKEGIINLLEYYQKEFHINPYYLREKIESFISFYEKEGGNILFVSLDNKINIYLKYLEEQRVVIRQEKVNKVRERKLIKNQEKLELITKCLHEFLESDFTTLESFCVSREIDLKDINELLNLCQRNNPILYKNYLSKLMVQKSSYNLDAIALSKQLACVVKNGVKLSNGEIRAYDIIDYYSMIGTSFKDTSVIITEQLNLEEVRTLKNFFHKNRLALPRKIIEIERIKEGKTKIGFPIQDNQNNTITYYPNSEEIELIIHFLEENNIPLNEFNYTIVLKRYLNNTLKIDNNTYVRRLQPN